MSDNDDKFPIGSVILLPVGSVDIPAPESEIHDGYVSVRIAGKNKESYLLEIPGTLGPLSTCRSRMDSWEMHADYSNKSKWTTWAVTKRDVANYGILQHRVGSKFSFSYKFKLGDMVVKTDNPDSGKTFRVVARRRGHLGACQYVLEVDSGMSHMDRMREADLYAGVISWHYLDGVDQNHAGFSVDESSLVAIEVNSENKDNSTMNAKKIIFVLEKDEFLFGECCREILAGNEPKYFEVFSPAGRRSEIANNIREQWGMVAAQLVLVASTYVESRFGLNRHRMTFVCNGERITIDIVTPNLAKAHPQHMCPVNVNALYHDVKGLRAFKGFNLQEIEKNIAEKVYIPTNVLDASAMKVLEKQGFKPKNQRKKYDVDETVWVKIRLTDGKPVDCAEDNWTHIEQRTILGMSVTKDYLVEEDVSGDPDDVWHIPASSIICSLNDVIEQVVREVQNVSEEVKKNMAEKIGFVAMTRSDIEEGGYRAATRQISKGTRALLAAFLKSQGLKKNAVKAIGELLDTEWGLGMVSWGLGMVLTHMPHLADDPRVKILAKEFRVEAFAIGIDKGMDSIREHFMPMIMQAISKIPVPPAEKLRVAEEAAAVQVTATKVRVEASAKTAEDEAEAAEESSRKTKIA